MCERIIVIIVLLGNFSSCFSQQLDEKNFKHYTVTEGLSHNYITGIEQDSKGYIWISTNRGLNRFDGVSFKQFLRTTYPNPIPGNSIYSMGLFGDELAIATDAGAQIISTKTLGCKNLLIPTTEALRYWSNACHFVHRDRDGNYGVSTKTGFYIFTRDGTLKRRFDYYSEKDIGKAWMMFGNHLYSLEDGNILQRNSIGLFIYDRNKNSIGDASSYYPVISELIRKKINNFYFVSSHDLLVINLPMNTFELVDIKTGQKKSFPVCFKAKDEIGWQSKLSRIGSNLWAMNSKNEGFFILNIDLTTRNIVCSPKRYFNSHFCNEFFVDKANRLWIGTDAGVYMETTSSPLIQSFKIEGEIRNDNLTITSLLITNDKIFAGTEKKTVLVIDKTTKRVVASVRLGPSANLSNEITDFQWLDRDTLWVASSSGLNWLNVKDLSNGEILPGKDTNTIFTIDFLYGDKRHNIWIPPNKINSIFYYNVPSRQLANIDDDFQPLFKVNIPNSVAEDAKGNIWFGGDAIARWNSRQKKIDTLIEYLSTQKNRKKGFSVMRDSKGEVWVMLNDDGFARITNKPLHVRPENILVDGKGVFPTLLYDKVFIPTTNGLGYFDINSLKGVVFTHSDGLPGTAVTSYHFAVDSSDHSTWFACKNIVCNIPSSPSYYRKPPILTISEVSVINDTVISYPQKFIELRHNQNDIRLSFSAINFADPENMRFAYRIKNKRDSSWIEAGTQPNILLTNISPGGYLVEIKAYAYDNKWPEQTKQINIIVRPPFWKTWWFLALFSLAVTTGIFFFYKSRIMKLRRKASIDKQMAEYEIKALHAQMNPHFIFNCLNSIREMVLNNENRQASHYLSKFAHLIRVTLNNSSKPFISLQETLDYLERYLEMEMIRTNHFSYNMHVDKAIQKDDVFLPPMLIQPFIENAIWHGASQNRVMRVDIRFVQQDNKLLCIVEDNGIGIRASFNNKNNDQINHNSIGISNVKQRIELLNEKYNLNSKVTIEDKSDLPWYDESGTIVTLQLAIKNDSA